MTLKKTVDNIIVLQVVDSTNNYANRLILSDSAEHGAVVLAHYQEKGKGQAGNNWESEAGKNLLSSVILYPNFLPADKQFYLSKITSLAIAGVLKKETDAVSIKWPNDIYVENRKIAGILIENSVKGNWLHASVLGMGINVNQEHFVSDAPNPVSLKQVTGREYDVIELATAIANTIYNWYDKLASAKLHEIDSSYFSRLYGKNEWRLYKTGDKTFEARITGIGELGQLILEDKKGLISRFFFKEVEFLL